MTDNKQSKSDSSPISGKMIRNVGILLFVLLVGLSVAQELGFTGKVGFSIAGVSAEFASSSTVQANQSPEEQFQKPVLLENQPRSAGGCPYEPTGFQMPYPNWWYADPWGSGNGIMYDSYGSFTIWDQNAYSYRNYPVMTERNMWVPFADSQFSVCVDNQLRVYAKYG